MTIKRLVRVWSVVASLAGGGRALGAPTSTPPSPPPQAVPAPPSPSPSPGPRRQGFTLELGLGVGATVVFDEVSSVPRAGVPGPTSSSWETNAYLAYVPLSLSVGWFVSENVALLLRRSGTPYFRAAGVEANDFVGPAVQLWTSDRTMLSAGIGLGAHRRSILEDGTPDFGVAASARAGHAVYAGESQVVRVGVELVPGVFDGTCTLGGAFTFEWQLL